jgi:hypothetical protein
LLSGGINNVEHTVFDAVPPSLSQQHWGSQSLPCKLPIPEKWIGTWSASPQPVWGADFPVPINFPRNLWNQTIRQIVRVSIGGKRVRVVLSNEYGTQPLLIGAAHVALSDTGSAIKAGSGQGADF